jgi:hypothetical protein
MVGKNTTIQLFVVKIKNLTKEFQYFRKFRAVLLVFYDHDNLLQSVLRIRTIFYRSGSYLQNYKNPDTDLININFCNFSKKIFLLKYIKNKSFSKTVYFSVLRSRSRKKPHLLVGAGAVTRCGSGSDNGIYHG